jgi:gliding motility-associated-like protein
MKYLFLFIFTFLWSWTVSFGQVCPTKFPADAVGGFTVVPQSCAPYSPRIRNSSLGTVTGYIYNYIPGTDYKDTTLYSIYKKTILPANAYTYTKAGKYCIIQLGSNGTASFASREVEVLSAPIPVAKAILCGPNEVVLTIPTDTSNVYNSYAINWGDGQAQEYKQSDSPITYTYAARTNNTISVTGIYPACSGDRFFLSNLPPYSPLLTPSMSLLEAKTGKLNLTFLSTAGLRTEVLQKTGNVYNAINPPVFDDGKAPTGNVTKVLNSASVQSINCFRVRTTDACKKTADSPEICNIPFTVDSQDAQNQIKWEVYPIASNFDQYSIVKNTVAYKDIKTIATVQDVDATVSCGEEYAYQMTVALKGMKFISEEVRIKANSTRPLSAIKTILPTVEKGKVAVLWIPETFSTKGYTIERSDKITGVFQPVGTSLSNRFDDLTALPSNQAYCYRISYKDQCSRVSDPSKPICTVFLNDNGSDLNWSPIDFANGTSGYEVEYLDQNGNSLNPPRTETVGLKLKYTPDFSDPTLSVLRFRIVAKSADNQVSNSNDVLLSLGVKVFVPTVFSPNNDGINDLFFIKGIGIKQATIKIYDRWGVVVYESDDRGIGWDGYINNSQASQGIYAYRIDYEDFAGNKNDIKGTVMLVR